MLLQKINHNFSYRLADYSDDIYQKIALFKKNIELIKIILEDNLYWFNIPCSNFAFVIAEYYAELKDKENTLKYLNESADYACALCNSPDEGEYDSYWLKGVKYTITKIKNYEGNYKVFDNPVFDFIKDTTEFNEVKNRYLNAYNDNPKVYRKN